MCYSQLKERLESKYGVNYNIVLSKCKIVNKTVDNSNNSYCICGKNIIYLYHCVYNDEEFILGSICILKVIENEKDNLDIKKFKKELFNKCYGCKKYKISKEKEYKNDICYNVCSSCRIGYNNYECRKCKTVVDYKKGDRKCKRCIINKEKEKGLFKCIKCNTKMKKNNNKYDTCFNCFIKDKIKCLNCKKKYISKNKFHCYDCYMKLIKNC